MLITLSILVLVYLVMGKDVKPIIEKVKSVDLTKKIRSLMEKLRPWALKAGRVAARPILQFYYVLEDENTSTLDKVMIYGAIAYVIFPLDLLPRSVFKLLGVLDDGVAVLFVYKRIKGRITPEIVRRVEERLDEWFGVEFEVV
ncbi:MAG: DUF1232 domain-containing protein [Alistipes sp.]|nr:DUF1232 domain-containing protein [Alistipes sp.]